MKVNYRGFEIDVRREKCLAGYKLMYFSIIRISDGFEMECSYTDSEDTVRDQVHYMKERVDAEIEEFPGWLEGKVPEHYR